MPSTIKLTKEEIAIVRKLAKADDTPADVKTVMQSMWERLRPKQYRLPPVDPVVGEEFRAWRKAHGIGLEYFSKYIAYSPITICQWESGYARLQRLAVEKLAELTNVSYEYLCKEIGYEDHKERIRCEDPVLADQRQQR